MSGRDKESDAGRLLSPVRCSAFSAENGARLFTKGPWLGLDTTTTFDASDETFSSTS